MAKDTGMKISFAWDGNHYTADLSAPIDISIPLMSGAENQPNAYGAPLFEATPVKAGDFVGSLDAGAPVNFFNITLNPHGNGTHTECVGHILKGPHVIRTALLRSMFVAELVSVTPEKDTLGAKVTKTQLETLRRYKADAMIVRSLPNPAEKKTRKYTGTNPPSFEVAAMQWVCEQGYQHLLTDLPSIDPEVDGGRLAGHKAFWNTEGAVRTACTITEMIYVPENVSDGLYLLDLHTVALELDASPSRPMLYVMEKAV